MKTVRLTYGAAILDWVVDLDLTPGSYNLITFLKHLVSKSGYFDILVEGFLDKINSGDVRTKIDTIVDYFGTVISDAIADTTPKSPGTKGESRAFTILSTLVTLFSSFTKDTAAHPGIERRKL